MTDEHAEPVPVESTGESSPTHLDAPHQQPTRPGPGRALGIWSLLLGIGSLLIALVVPLTFWGGVASAVLGTLALREYRKPGADKHGRWTAIAGTVLGYVTTLLYVLLTAVALYGLRYV